MCCTTELGKYYTQTQSYSLFVLSYITHYNIMRSQVMAPDVFVLPVQQVRMTASSNKTFWRESPRTSLHAAQWKKDE